MKASLFANITILIFMLLLCSCSSTPTPPEKQVILTIQNVLPNYLQVNGVEIEALTDSNHPAAETLKAVASITVKENLYIPASSDELKPLQEVTDAEKTFSDWFDKESHSNSASYLGDNPVKFTQPKFAHLAQKAGDSLNLTCALQAVQKGDDWSVTLVPESIEYPVKLGMPGEVGVIAINTTEGADALTKSKNELESAHQYEGDTQAKIDKANRDFSDTISPWLTGGKSYFGTYEDKVLGGTRVERIQVSFDHFNPNTGTFQGHAVFLTVHNGVMTFQGEVRDLSLYLNDMKVVADPMELTPDTYWVLRLSEGNLVGTYPEGAITLYAPTIKYKSH